ncbi:MAG: DoxX family protein [Thermodesulfobacteriota bacterium]
MLKKLIYSKNYVDVGLLVLRIGIGIAFVLHGYPKLFLGGAAGLAKGLAAAGIPGGIAAAYLAAMAEFFGGIALIFGVLFRPVTVVMAFTMLVALTFHLNKGDGFVKYSHALESAILFISLIFIGPGKFSLDEKLFGPAPESRECEVLKLETKSA